MIAIGAIIGSVATTLDRAASILAAFRPAPWGRRSKPCPVYVTAEANRSRRRI